MNIVNISVLQITGLGMLGVGIWMKVDPYVVNYFTVVSFAPSNAALNAAAAIFIAGKQNKFTMSCKKY